MGNSGLDKTNIVIFSPISETENYKGSPSFDRLRKFLDLVKSDEFIQELKQRGLIKTTLNITEYYLHHLGRIDYFNVLMRKKGHTEKMIKDSELSNLINKDSIILLLYYSKFFTEPSTYAYGFYLHKYLPSSVKRFFVALDLDCVFTDYVYTEEQLEEIRENYPPSQIEKWDYEAKEHWITGKETGDSLEELNMKKFSTKLNLGCSANHPDSVLRLFEFLSNVLLNDALYNPPQFRHIDFFNTY
ncbi:hypothetical protein CEE45_04735 [Candidatus Heimdallarchaeota archaeon B3_Heim]|nr:MAG: hypothetical protein CEE45_04735 [Candidatus Heimdallarchaeota archaeon B3_Heim]